MAAAATRRSRAARAPYNRRETRQFYLFIAPWLAGFFIWLCGPMLYSLYLSFTRWDLLSPPRWRGIGNYISMLSDNLWWQALKVTSLYTLFKVPLALVVALTIGLLMALDVRGIRWFRTLLYLPNVLPTVAVAVLWMYLFHPSAGLINSGLARLGMGGPGWITDPHWALPALIIMSFWGVGGAALIFLAGLKSVPPSLYEAAEIDGANRWQQFWHITIPQLSPTILFNLVLAVIGSFQVFTEAYVMTNGGPRYATFFYVFYLYQKAFIDFSMGYASAMAWVLFAIILTCTLLIFRFSAGWVYYAGEKQ